MILPIILEFITTHCLLLLIGLVTLLILVNYAEYIRIGYYAIKFPGSFAYPLIGHAHIIMGKTHGEVGDVLLNCISVYGRAFKAWLGPIPIFILSKPDYIQKILNDSHGLEKPWIMTKFAVDLVGESLLTAPVSKWKQNRSKVVRGFTPIILKSYFKVFVETTAYLTEKLDAKLNDPKSFDIFELLSKTSMDSVCQSTMGVNVNAHDENCTYFKALQRVFAITFDRLYNPWKLINFLFEFTKDIETLTHNKEIIRQLAAQIISEKRRDPQLNNNFGERKTIEKNAAQKPLLDFLLDIIANDPTTMSEEQLQDELILIMVAGFEATASALSYTLLSLAKHKHIQDKVFEELFAVLGADRTIEVDDLPHLKYTEMVIKEATRMFAPIPIIGRELTKDFQLDEHIVPKGAVCMIPICAYHRDEEIWPDPMKFDPERFTPENIKKRHPYAHIPFSGGPRNCLGIRYAWMFMKVVMATLLRRYEFHTDLNFDAFQYEIELSLKLIGGHQVRITPRVKN